MLGETVADRVRSLVEASPFALTEAPEPWSFALVPQTGLAGAYRVTQDTVLVRSGFAYTEEHVDELTLYVAYAMGDDAPATARSLTTLATSLTAAVVRDGTVGDYGVDDTGRRVMVTHDLATNYQVLRLTLPVSYMLAL